MSRIRATAVATLIALVAALSTTATGDSTSEDARKVVQANEEAVVTALLVLEISSSYGGETNKREQKVSSTATVIDPSGLVVTSLSATNPTDMFGDVGGDEEFKVSARAIDVKIRLADGTELPADVVLRDRDLDLAFLKPRKAPDKPLKFVDLSQAGVPQTLDQLVVLSRLGQAASRALAACVDRVQAVITKPRTLYAMTSPIYMGMGFPAFTMDGKPAGLLVLRISQNRSSDDSSFGEGRVLAAVLPCATIQKAAEQAKTAQPEQQDAAKPAPKPAPKAAPRKK